MVVSVVAPGRRSGTTARQETPAYGETMSAPLIWLVVGLGLGAAEMLTGDMSLLMLGGGALAAAGAAALGFPLWADGAVFLVVSVLLLVLVRPVLRRRLAAGAGLPEPVKALEGRPALVLNRVSRHQGQVKLDGEVWTARPLNEDDSYEPGDQVTVMHIDGATAVVWRNP
jgi:membrane protein implicated in regulation of membrane protease activity